MQQCSGTNADSDATWHNNQATATARTRFRMAFMAHRLLESTGPGKWGYDERHMQVRVALIIAASCLVTGCNFGKSPTAATPIAAPSPPPVPPPLPTTVPGVLSV